MPTRSRSRLERQAQVLLYFVFALILILKLSTLFRPFLGYFASYQLSSGMIAKSFLLNGFHDPLIARTFYFMKGEPAVILLFVPLNSLLAALGFKVFGISMDFWGRMVSILFSTGSIILFYHVVRRFLKNVLDRYFAVLVFLLCPAQIIMGQSFFNESLALFFFLLGLVVIIKPKKFKASSVIAGSAICAFAFTLRIHFIFLAPLLPLYLYMNAGKRGTKLIMVTVVTVTAVTGLWLAYIYQEGFKYPSLHSSFFMQLGESQRFSLGEKFLKNMPEHLWAYALEPAGFTLMIIGLAFFAFSSETVFFLAWLILGALVALVLPQKAVDHPFYLLPMVPGASVFAGRAIRHLLELRKKILPVVILVCVELLMSLRIVAGPLFVDVPAAHSLKKAAALVRTQTNPDDEIIVSHGLPTAVLYYADRYGWNLPIRGSDASVISRLDEIMKMRPADYYLVVEPDKFLDRDKYFSEIKHRFKVVEETRDLLLVSLGGK